MGALQDHIRCYFKQLLLGLHFIHSHKPAIIHRDIKGGALVTAAIGRARTLCPVC